MDEVSALAALTGHFELAVRLLAASAQQRMEIRIPSHALGLDRERDLEGARLALGAAGAAAAEQAGRELPYPQALAEARGWLRGTPANAAAP